jgi:hypothetical protein
VKARARPPVVRAPRRLAAAVRDALTHYWIGLETAGIGLPVAWDSVAQRMAEALEGALYGNHGDEEARS